MYEVELFCGISWRLLAINYFCKSSIMDHWRGFGSAVYINKHQKLIMDASQDLSQNLEGLTKFRGTSVKPFSNQIFSTKYTLNEEIFENRGIVFVYCMFDYLLLNFKMYKYFLIHWPTSWYTICWSSLI